MDALFLNNEDNAELAAVRNNYTFVRPVGWQVIAQNLAAAMLVRGITWANIERDGVNRTHIAARAQEDVVARGDMNLTLPLDTFGQAWHNYVVGRAEEPLSLRDYLEGNF
jgi:hypothetical protein